MSDLRDKIAGLIADLCADCYAESPHFETASAILALPEIAERDALREKADTLAYRAESAFSDRYHHTSHIQGAKENYQEDRHILAEYRKAAK